MLGVRCWVDDAGWLMPEDRCRNVDVFEDKNTRSCCIYCCFLTGSEPDAASFGGGRRTRAGEGPGEKRLAGETDRGQDGGGGGAGREDMSGGGGGGGGGSACRASGRGGGGGEVGLVGLGMGGKSRNARRSGDRREPAREPGGGGGGGGGSSSSSSSSSGGVPLDSALHSPSAIMSSLVPSRCSKHPSLERQEKRMCNSRPSNAPSASQCQHRFQWS